MGCPASVDIGKNLTFSVCTHDPYTGILTDADAVPSYRVYEDETATAIMNGVMAKLDDANTTGFYSEQLACTLANGFEAGKSYTVYIEATVSSDTGGICYGFNCLTPAAGAGGVTWTYTVTDADTGGPIDGCDVWLTTDSAGSNVVASGSTNTLGVITMYVDAGTYYVWRKHAGYDFTNPDSEIIS